LIDGELTTDEFTTVYSEMGHSPDMGVAEIALFGWGLYSDDLVRVCLKEKNAVDSATRRIAERCLQFLETDLEFCWPKTIDHWLRSMLRSMVIYLLAWIAATPGFVIGAMLLIGVAIDGFHGGWFTLYVLLAASAMLLFSAGIVWATHRYERRKHEHEWQQYRRAGDWDVWPFHTFAEYSSLAENPT
jgi:hypothetical protein